MHDVMHGAVRGARCDARCNARCNARCAYEYLGLLSEYLRALQLQLLELSSELLVGLPGRQTRRDAAGRRALGRVAFFEVRSYGWRGAILRRLSRPAYLPACRQVPAPYGRRATAPWELLGSTAPKGWLREAS